MRIIYNPFFERHQYVALANQGILMGTDIVSTEGLIELFELHLGLHRNEESILDRAVRYHSLLKRYITSHPNCVLAASFKIAELSVAKSCLAWRDDLVLYGWDATSAAPSERLRVLQAIEKDFAKTDVCLVSRIADVKKVLAANPTIFEGSTIQLMIPREQLPPYINSLFSILKGVAFEEPAAINLEDVLNKTEIWHFRDENQAYKHIATMKDSYDVWINKDNKVLDNWLHMSGKLTTGSHVTSTLDPIQMLLILTARIMARPLQLKSLVDYLLLPIHPLSDELRRPLAEKAAEKGGYYNADCQQEIEKYIQKLRDNNISDRKIQEEKIALFLPSGTLSLQENIPADEIIKRYNALSDWANRRSRYEREKDGSDEQLALQLAALNQQIRLLLKMVSSSDNLSYTLEQLEQLIAGFVTENNNEQYAPLTGCQEVVSSPGDIISLPDRVLWIHPAAEDAQPLSLDWLTTVEREQLAIELQLWDKDNERKARYTNILTPLRASKKIVLVEFERYQGARASVSSLILKLKAINDTSNGNLGLYDKDLSGLPQTTLTPINNKITEDYIQLQRADKLQLRDIESASALELMINHPLDYVMNHVVHIKPKAATQPADIKTIKGITAHAILEELLVPYNEFKSKMTDEKYSSIVDKNIQAHGAPLLQLENQLELRRFKHELRECVEHLADILSKNHLRVVACEQSLTEKLGFLSQDDINIQGFVDCRLEDQYGNPVVFDFKWTSSDKYYQELLKENKSIQLALYCALIQLESKKEVKRSAYFLMPEGRLYSTSDFSGEYCHRIESDNNNDLLQQIKNSYAFRSSELIAGKIETTEATHSADFDYFQNTEAMKLVPLKVDIGARGGGKGKETNLFSDFNFLLTSK